MLGTLVHPSKVADDVRDEIAGWAAASSDPCERTESDLVCGHAHFVASLRMKRPGALGPKPDSVGPQRGLDGLDLVQSQDVRGRPGRLMVGIERPFGGHLEEFVSELVGGDACTC